MTFGDIGMPAEGKNWLHAAGVIWPILVKAAGDGTLLRYKELGQVLGIHHRNVNKALNPIQLYCIDTRRPPLTVLVVGPNLLPGAGFIAWDLGDLDAILTAVRAYNWTAVPNPFGQVGQAESEKAMVRRLVQHPEQAEAVYKQVPDRGVAQRLFRSAVASAYGHQCAFCRCSFPGALDAAHIMPWASATPAQRLDVRNGILLCATHHRMFDDAIITPTADRLVRYYDPDAAEGVYSAADTALGPALHGQPMHLPADQNAWPAVDLIQERLTFDGWEDELAGA